MKYGLMGKIYGYAFYQMCKNDLSKSVSQKDIKEIRREYKAIHRRAKDIGSDNKLYMSYTMCMFYIAMNRQTNLTAEVTYQILHDGIKNSGLIQKFLGTADAYLDQKKMAGRLKWSEKTHQKQYENDWVVDILPGCDEYDLGYDYTECGVCKLCRDEGCLELAAYNCRIDFLLAEMIGMELKRTTNMAEGGSVCDFRYRKIS